MQSGWTPDKCGGRSFLLSYCPGFCNVKPDALSPGLENILQRTRNISWASVAGTILSLLARRKGWMKGGRVPSDVSPLTTLPLGVPSFPGLGTRTTHWSLPQLGCCLSWPPSGTSLLCSTSRRTRWYALRSGQSVSLQELSLRSSQRSQRQSPSSRDSFLSSRPEGVDLPLQIELIPASCLHLQVQLKLNNTNDTLIDSGTYTRHYSFLVRVQMYVLHVSAVGFHHFPYTFERRAASVIPVPIDIMNEIPTGPVMKSLLVIWRV